MNLAIGGNTGLPNTELTVNIFLKKAADISAFRLFENNKVRNDEDMVFYGQKINDDQTISLMSEGVETKFKINLHKMRTDAQKIAFTISADAGNTMSSLGDSLRITVEDQGQTLLVCELDLKGRSEAALILGEVYRRNQEWKFRFVAQGFNGGLKPLAEHYGVTIANEAPPAPNNPAPIKVNLSKVTLSKEQPKVNLNKKDDYGQIRINLNWHQAEKKSAGFLGSIMGSKGVDLDLGAFVRLKSGEKYVIQSLGNAMGDYERVPFVALQGDDRTGAISSGEWLHINGKHWNEIDEILIYAFIYSGVANWSLTDGKVILHAPDQAPIETQLNNGDNRSNMCAIARLSNQNGLVSVERLNTYFNGHKALDDAYNWGFNWKRGSK